MQNKVKNNTDNLTALANILWPFKKSTTPTTKLFVNVSDKIAFT